MVWFSTLTDVSINSKMALIDTFGSAEAAFNAPAGAITGIEGVTAHDAEILERKDLSAAEDTLKKCIRNGIMVLTPDMDGYPRRLKDIFGPPTALYVKGTLPVIDGEPVLAIIGTREPTDYGRRMALDISYQYALCGGTVVSGLTRGIDELAAKGAAAAGGKVIGVLGTEITAYNGRLEDKILKNGAIVSEYPPDTPSQKHFYRHRNRIAAGLSAGVCAVEAPAKSGTLLFIAEALEQGKEIFALPGNADSENSAGTLRCIREGAAMVTSGREIAEELSYMFPDRLDASVTETYRSAQSKKTIDNENGGCYIDLPVSLRESLSDSQKTIVTAVLNGANSIDAIVRATGLSAAAVLAQVTILEVKKILSDDPEKGITAE